MIRVLASVKTSSANAIEGKSTDDSTEAMDVMLRECFLQAASTRIMDWNMPMKGTKLYTQHVRPCRRAGWSVSVKESSFRHLGVFLAKLEEEKLLELKKGEPDPVVTRICR